MVSSCLLKMALLGLRLHQHFIVFYLGPKASMKAHFSKDRCQIIIVKGKIHATYLLLGHFVDTYPLLLKKIFFLNGSLSSI